MYCISLESKNSSKRKEASNSDLWEEFPGNQRSKTSKPISKSSRLTKYRSEAHSKPSANHAKNAPSASSYHPLSAHENWSVINQKPVCTTVALVPSPAAKVHSHYASGLSPKTLVSAKAATTIWPTDRIEVIGTQNARSLWRSKQGKMRLSKERISQRSSNVKTTGITKSQPVR